MLFNIVKATTLAALVATASMAGDFNKQAEKDREGIVKYFEAKFSDPVKDKNTFFPYSTDDELKNNFIKNIKGDEFSKGGYAFSKNVEYLTMKLKNFHQLKSL